MTNTMVLVDTSIWIDHFCNSNEELKKLLIAGQVCSHPFVVGELSCGNISNRKEILTLLRTLPRIDNVLDEEVFVPLRIRSYMGRDWDLSMSTFLPQPLFIMSRFGQEINTYIEYQRNSVFTAVESNQCKKPSKYLPRPTMTCMTLPIR